MGVYIWCGQYFIYKYTHTGKLIMINLDIGQPIYTIYLYMYQFIHI
jgi:hypothetical protein